MNLIRSALPSLLFLGSRGKNIHASSSASRFLLKLCLAEASRRRHLRALRVATARVPPPTPLLLPTNQSNMLPLRRHRQRRDQGRRRRPLPRLLRPRLPPQGATHSIQMLWSLQSSTRCSDESPGLKCFAPFVFFQLAAALFLLPFDWPTCTTSSLFLHLTLSLSLSLSPFPKKNAGPRRRRRAARPRPRPRPRPPRRGGPPTR